VELPLTIGPVAAWLTATSMGAVDVMTSRRACEEASGRAHVRSPDHEFTWSRIVEAARSASFVDLSLPVPGDPGTTVAWDGQPGARVSVGTIPPGGTAADRLSVIEIRVVSTELWSVTLRDLRRDQAVGPATSGASAARLLASAVRESADVIASLGLDRPDPRVRQQLLELEGALGGQWLPPTLRSPDRIVTASRILLITSVALDSAGAAITGQEMHARSGPLHVLAAAARRALTAAYLDVGTVRT